MALKSPSSNLVIYKVHTFHMIYSICGDGIPSPHSLQLYLRFYIFPSLLLPLLLPTDFFLLPRNFFLHTVRREPSPIPPGPIPNLSPIKCKIGFDRKIEFFFLPLTHKLSANVMEESFPSGFVRTAGGRGERWRYN